MHCCLIGKSVSQVVNTKGTNTNVDTFLFERFFERLAGSVGLKL